MVDYLSIYQMVISIRLFTSSTIKLNIIIVLNQKLWYSSAFLEYCNKSFPNDKIQLISTFP